MFGKDKNENSNEKVLYEGQPNIIVYSKGILFAMILLGVLFFLYTTGIQYIGNMQVYMIESSKLPLTRYFAIALFIIMIVVIAYMVIKILKWTSIHYTITESRVTVEEGLIFNKKNSMPFNTIQDVGRSQNIFGKLFSVGSITLYSAYDGKDLELKDLSNPKKVENLIFENMRGTHLRSRNLYDDGYDSGYVNGPNSGYNNRPYNPNNNYDAYGAAYAGAAYSSKDPDEKQHYRRMEDLDDLELVDVKERKRNLREIRRKARDSRKIITIIPMPNHTIPAEDTIRISSMVMETIIKTLTMIPIIIRTMTGIIIQTTIQEVGDIIKDKVIRNTILITGLTDSPITVLM